MAVISSSRRSRDHDLCNMRRHDIGYHHCFCGCGAKIPTCSPLAHAMGHHRQANMVCASYDRSRIHTHSYHHRYRGCFGCFRSCTADCDGRCLRISRGTPSAPMAGLSAFDADLKHASRKWIPVSGERHALVCHQQWHLGFAEHGVGHAAEDPLPPAPTAVGAHHQDGALLLGGLANEQVGHLVAFAL